VSPWGVAMDGGQSIVKKLPLKSPREARGRRPRRGAWRRDRMVRSSEGGCTLRASRPRSPDPARWDRAWQRWLGSIAAPRSCMTPSRPSRMKRVHLTSPVSARDPQGAVGVIENPHLNGLDESVEVNVGGSGRAAKGSQSTDDIPARRRPHSRPRTGTPPPWRRGPGA